MIKNQLLGDNLFEARKKAKLSQEQLAGIVNVSTSTISAYENGAKNPSLNNIIKIAHALNVSLDKLCGVRQKYYINEKPLEALLVFLEKFKPEIKFNDNNKQVILEFNQESSDISGNTILRFFDEYAKIREIENMHLGNEKMIKILEDDLRKRYKNLPGLQDYDQIRGNFNF